MWGRGQGEGVVTKSRTTERKSRTLNRSRARNMRREPSAIENEFWQQVRDRKLGGFKFPALGSKHTLNCLPD